MEKTPEIKHVGTQLNLFGAPVPPPAPKNHTPKKPSIDDELDDESEEEEMSDEEDDFDGSDDEEGDEVEEEYI